MWKEEESRLFAQADREKDKNKERKRRKIERLREIERRKGGKKVRSIERDQDK